MLETLNASLIFCVGIRQMPYRHIRINILQIPNTACISEKVVTATLVQQMKDTKMQKLFISHLLIRKTRNSIIILQLNLLT